MAVANASDGVVVAAVRPCAAEAAASPRAKPIPPDAA